MTDISENRTEVTSRRSSFSGWEQLLGLDGSTPLAFDETVKGTDDQAVTYLRVSTQRQMHTAIDIDADGNSIATQRETCHKRSKRLKAPIIREFVEPGNSAQSIAKRPVFRELLRYVEENREVRYVIIYMRSRIFRNQADAAITKRILGTMGVKLISAKEEFGEGYMADAMEAITDIMNEVQVRQSGEDIKQKLLNKAKSGGTVGRAKLGYLNVRKDFDGRLVNTIDIDPVRAPLIRWAFEQYASGDFSMIKLQHALAEQGLMTRKSSKWPERPLSRSQLGLILRDPYYLGMVTFKGQLFPGRHEALIAPDLFERVQQVIDARMKRGQRDIVHNHFLRGMLHCGRCHDAGREHRLIFTEAKNRDAQIYEYFLCRGRQDGNCDLPYLPTNELERAIGRHFALLQLSTQAIADAKDQVSAALDHLLDSQTAQHARLTKELKKLDIQEERLIHRAADGTLATAKLRERLRGVQVKKHRLRDQLATTDEKLHNDTNVVLAYLDLLERPEELYVGAPDVVKRKLLAAFFTRIWIDDDGHQLTAHAELQPVVASIRSATNIAALANKKAPEKSPTLNLANHLTFILRSFVRVKPTW